jgi:hypothetical protein
MTITIPDSTQHSPPPDGFSHLPYAGFNGRTAGEQDAASVATGSITTIVAANLLDTETFTLDDGTNTPTVFEFERTAPATGSITTIAVASLVDGEIFTLDDGVNTAVVFEFDVAGDGVTAGRTVVDVSTDTSADEVRDRIIAAINLVAAPLLITAGNGGAATVDLTNDNAGTVGNTSSSENVTNAGFVLTDMTGGLGGLGVSVPNVAVNLAGDTTANDVRDTIIAAINGSSVGMVASDGGAATVTLTSAFPGSDGNTTSAETVADAGFILTDMTSGAGGMSFDPATLEITADYSWDNPQVANPEALRIVPRFRFSAALHHGGRALLEVSPQLVKRRSIRFY